MRACVYLEEERESEGIACVWRVVVDDYSVALSGKLSCVENSNCQTVC